jgi:hypothetical protein
LFQADYFVLKMAVVATLQNDAALPDAELSDAGLKISPLDSLARGLAYSR